MRMLRLKLSITAVLVTLLCTSSTHAGTPCLSIVGAKVVLPGGHSKVVNVTIEDGITAVGKSSPKNCSPVDGKGKTLLQVLLKLNLVLALLK